MGLGLGLYLEEEKVSLKFIIQVCYKVINFINVLNSFILIHYRHFMLCD